MDDLFAGREPALAPEAEMPAAGDGTRPEAAMTDGAGSDGAGPDGAGWDGADWNGAGPDGLLMLELRHRFRNVVTITQALVNQTLRGDVSVAEARELLNQRLVAMGTAVDLLLDSDWQPGSIGTVVREVMAHHAGHGDRIRCVGPDVPAGSNAVLMLSLVLHELGTNATKHGALSAPGGRVDLVWEVVADGSGGLLRMRWSEHGGPAVKRPVRTGFGSRLVSSTIVAALGGQAQVDYGPLGLTWLLCAPLQRIAQ